MTLTQLQSQQHPQVAGKWVRKPDARPDEVLAAALDLFTSNGFASTRMEDIAKAAGLSKAAIYLYFPSKDDVFKALVVQRVGLLRDTVAQIGGLDHEDPVSALRAVARAWAMANGDARMAALPRIVLTEAHRFPEMAAFYHSTVIERTHAIIVQLIDTGMRQGLFREVDPIIAARALIGPLLFETLRRQAFGSVHDSVQESSQPLVEMAEAFFDLFLTGLVATIPPRDPSYLQRSNP